MDISAAFHIQVLTGHPAAVVACQEDHGRRDVIIRITDPAERVVLEVVDMEALAAYCGCSLSHLRHRFKEETGISMVQYIRKKKIERAKLMLADTDYPIAKISSQLGFCAESYFITVFRQETGMTPRRFRER